MFVLYHSIFYIILYTFNANKFLEKSAMFDDLVISSVLKISRISHDGWIRWFVFTDEKWRVSDETRSRSSLTEIYKANVAALSPRRGSFREEEKGETMFLRGSQRLRRDPPIFRAATREKKEKTREDSNNKVPVVKGSLRRHVRGMLVRRIAPRRRCHPRLIVRQTSLDVETRGTFR